MKDEEIKYDIFIAYHGDETNGTQKIACEIYKKIEGHKTSTGKTIRAFCKPMSLPYADFAETPRIVARTPLLLLVVNKNIPVNEYGQIAERTCNGNLKYLYQEIKAFRESDYYKSAQKGLVAKLLLCDDFGFDKAAKLDPIFSGTEAFNYAQNNIIEEIINWINYTSDLTHDMFSKNYPIDTANQIDWNQDRAKTWHKMKPPSRPALSELEIYRKYFEYIKRKKRDASKPKALILGSTVEFRKLAAEEGFDITVVDYSKAYYEEISKELSEEEYDLKNEIYLECDWCEMKDQLTSNKYDIIIGDLSVGNVAPLRLNSFFENIAFLLTNRGFFLGKSIYKYTNYNINSDKIDELLENMVKNENITGNNIYSYTMYPLSIFAGGGDASANKINFQNLYDRVKVVSNQYKTDKFAIFLNENTQFNEKMPKEFYIYSYQTILNQLEQFNLTLEDVDYSKEVFKNDFPLLIVRKKQTENTNLISINSFLGSRCNNYLEIWKHSISSKYFLYNIEGYIRDDELKDHMIRLLNNAKIKVDDKLNYYLLEIPEESMQKETQLLTNKTELSENSKVKDELQMNYTCGILASLIHYYKDNTKQGEQLLRLILHTLFANKKQQGNIWIPYESPWVSARICICLFPIYKEWKNDNNATNKYVSKLEDVVSILADKDIEDTNYFWESETGSHFDTSALCIETLYLYCEFIKNERLKNKIDSILNEYVRNNHIKETFIKFPIYKSIIEQVCNRETINDKPAYKKLCGRIAWYTIIYIICKDWGEKNKDTELLEASDYLATQLKKFWYRFTKKADSIVTATIEEEKSIVPQILYCLKRTKLFD